jgi:glycosyltransferase involved in cell wall biosynthesis
MPYNPIKIATVIGARPQIINTYPKVRNFPLLRLVQPTSGEERLTIDRIVLAYPGGLTRDRGLHVMLETARLLEKEGVELHLMGKFTDTEDEQIAKKIANVKYLGFLPLAQVYAHLATAHIGLLVLQPAYRYSAAEATKLFEYMLCGLPVIASNFPGFQRFIEDNHCRLCVDPTQPEKVASAILALCRDPHLREILGQNGRKVVLEKYNWESESQVLLGIYEQVLAGFIPISATSPQRN